MQGLATGQLDASDKLQAHLDGCLSCRACESVCPAQVPYGELIDAVRGDLQQTNPNRNRSLRWLAFWLTQARPRTLLARLLLLLQVSGLLRLAKRLSKGIKPLERRLQFIPAMQNTPARRRYAVPDGVQKRGTVQLFTGCVSELFDARSLHDAITCLQYCGFEVDVPVQQGCCGALHQHNGMHSQAQSLFANNIKAFGAHEQPVLGTASGCTAMLAEYEIYQDSQQAKDFSARIQDISAFIFEHWSADTAVAAFNGRAVVQDACTLRNVLGSSQAVYRLLDKIPGLDIVPLPDNNQCCGAAGSMMFSHPDQADALVNKKIQAIEALGGKPPEYLLSSNIGCALHLQAALKRAGIELEVLHPVSLLARQLKQAEN